LINILNPKALSLSKLWGLYNENISSTSISLPKSGNYLKVKALFYFILIIKAKVY